MKNINKYILLLAVLVFAGCDPLADEIALVEAENSIPSADFEYTFTDDDYDTADDFCSCAGFGSFGSEDDVKSAIPVVLTDVFPALGNGSSALVTYRFFNGSSPDLRGTYTSPTITTQEYEDCCNNTFGNFSDIDEGVVEYATWKYPNAEDGDYADVTFEFISFSPFFITDTTSRVVYTVAYGWQYAWILPQEVYDFFGESSTEFPDGSGTFTPDFSFEDEASEKMHIYLNANTDPFTEEGDIIVVQFNFDNGADNAVENPTEQDVIMYIYDGTEWLLYNDHFQVTDQTLAFGHDGTDWIPDNTIKYTITAADFTEIGLDENGLGTQGARDNLNQFGNFNTGDWTHEEIVAAINFILKLNFPGNEVGQKYIVTYNTFPGGDLTVNLILDESGEYVEQTEG